MLARILLPATNTCGNVVLRTDAMDDGGCPVKYWRHSSCSTCMFAFPSKVCRLLRPAPGGLLLHRRLLHGRRERLPVDLEQLRGGAGLRGHGDDRITKCHGSDWKPARQISEAVRPER